MFPDSKIAQNYSQHETKMKYNIQFGIAPYIKEILIKDRNRHRRCFVRKGVLRNFAKFTGVLKQLDLSKILLLETVTRSTIRSSQNARQSLSHIYSKKAD